MKRLRLAIGLSAGLMVGATLPACSDRSGETGSAPGKEAMEAASARAGAAPASAQDLEFTAPAGWIAETPSSSMRKAQYRLPRAEGDPEDAEMNVFFFSGEGGAVQDNIDRWISQFQKSDGSPAAGAVSRREVHGIIITIVDVGGIYLSGSGMMTETKAKPNFRMLAAVAETPAGPWFFKLTGPAATIARWESSFQSFIDTIQ